MGENKNPNTSSLGSDGLNPREFGEKYSKERWAAERKGKWYVRSAVYEGHEGVLYFDDFNGLGIPNFAWRMPNGDIEVRSMQEKAVRIVDKNPLEITLEEEKKLGGSHVYSKEVPFHRVLMGELFS